MWGFPRPGIEPVSPTLAGELFTTEPPGKPHPPSSYFIVMWLFSYLDWETNLDEPDFYLPLCQWHKLIFLPQLASIHSTSSSEDTALPIIVFWIVSLTSSKARKAELINFHAFPPTLEGSALGLPWLVGDDGVLWKPGDWPAHAFIYLLIPQLFLFFFFTFLFLNFILLFFKTKNILCWGIAD